VNLLGLAGLGIVVLVAIFLAVLSIVQRRSPFSFRSIRAYSRVRRAASMVVEDGTRLHVALGSASILNPAGASALAGLALLRRLGEITSLSDRPPIATTGSGELNLLAQDTLRTAHESVAVDQIFDMNNARMTGFTPLSYTAGVMPSIHDENISNNVLIGNFGPEIGLLIDASDRNGSPAIAASDSLTAQAVLYAASSEPLIGEELFAAGAYVQAGATHSASLVVQDVLRWLIIIALIIAAILGFLGRITPAGGL
jgi:hypothetical protein